MCTVTFVRSESRIIITSNRDEKVERASNKPELYRINDKKVIFPKDPIAGGTWYAVDETGNVLVLLNGAFQKHERKLPYRRSRGLIVLDIIGANAPYREWVKIDLYNIEPFTLVLLENGRLWQLRWNGNEKETLELVSTANHIWSSPMLYSEVVVEAREISFLSFLNSPRTIHPEDMVEFHSSPEKAGIIAGLVIERSFLKTISITQSVIGSGTITMFHKDLVHGEEFTNSYSG